MAGSPREWIKRILAPMEASGLAVDTVMEQPVQCPTAPIVPFSDHIFPTRSGKFEFITVFAHQPRLVPGFPLVLVTNFAKTWLLSQMLESEHPKRAFIRIGTETANEFGISHKEEVIIRSPAGQLKVEAHVDENIGRGMVMMPVGTWIKRGGGANVLTEDIMSNFGEMAAYGETRVTLERVAEAVSGPAKSSGTHVAEPAE